MVNKSLIVASTMSLLELVASCLRGAQNFVLQSWDIPSSVCESFFPNYEKQWENVREVTVSDLGSQKIKQNVFTTAPDYFNIISTIK